MTDLHQLWRFAVVAYTLATFAATALSWCISRGERRGPETNVLAASLVVLALQYAVLAIDAWVHAGALTASVLTPWAALGRALGAVCWFLLMLFLLATVERGSPTSRRDPWLRVWVLIPGALFVVVCVASFVDVTSDRFGRAFDVFAVRPAVILPLLGSGALFRILFARLPQKDRWGWVKWLNGAGLEAPAADNPETATDSEERGDSTNLKALFTLRLTAVLVWIHGYPFWTMSAWTAPWLLTSIASGLLLLPSLTGLIYHQTQFVFFDVVLKRGMVFLGLAGLTVTGCVVAAELTLPLPRDQQVLLIALTAAGCVSTALAVVPHVDQWLDRRIFRRSNYAVELGNLLVDMTRCRTVDTLHPTVTSRLAAIIDAAFVTYTPTAITPSALVIGLGRPAQHHGYLSFGTRAKGQPYGTVDLAFAQAVAAHFAGLLDSFAAREAHLLAIQANDRALRAQIQPHFLFNALSTVVQMAKGNAVLERTALQLTHTVRHVLEATRCDVLSLRAEVLALRAYVELERQRFEQPFTLDVEIPDALWDVGVPPLLLQPLVENALHHGLWPKGRGGTVWVTASEHGRRLRLRVADDGVGFLPAETPLGVGLANVRSRVEQDGGECHVWSRPGDGTEVTCEVSARWMPRIES